MQWNKLDESSLRLPPIIPHRHKYQAGYVLGLSGSTLFQGAPKLAGLAALRAGAGIVRIFHQGDIGSSPMELIAEPWGETRWHQELKRANSLFVGPGLGIDRPTIDFASLLIPLVVDADYLQEDLSFPQQAILTPHRQEMARLLGVGTIGEEELFARAQKFVDERRVIVVLKGAPTFVFSQDTLPLLIDRGDPGMATAGSGDVLTGIIAALLAQKIVPREAAVLGVYLHAVAGETAASDLTSYSMIASDLLLYLHKAFKQFPP
jgi:NAD(P)H-hydrate epimerase